MFTAILCFSALPVKAEEDIEWCGYYELQYQMVENNYVAGGLLKVEKTDLPSGKLNKAVVIDKDGNTFNLGKNFTVDKNAGTVYFYGLEQFKSQLTLGKDYTLKVTGNNGVGFEVKFTYLTKAIGTAEDVKVLDISSGDVHLDGYYVLTNNIVLEKGQENNHAGISSSSYAGFAGTFDGQGHTITFDATNGKGFFGKIVSHKVDLEGNVVIHNELRDTDNDGTKTLHVLRVRTPDGKFVDRDGNANDNEINCLNWDLLSGPTIKNVAFVNCKVKQSAVVAKNSNLVYDGFGLVKDVYIRVSPDSDTPYGVVFDQSSIWCMVENVFIETPEQSVDALVLDWGRSGCLYSTDGNREHSSRDKYHKNIFIISDMFLAYQRPGAADTRPGLDNWYMIYAENELAEADPENGKHVYKNVFKYKTHELLKQANHDYSAFNTEYWDLSLGIPVWKFAKADVIAPSVVTDAYVRNGTVTLEVGKDTAKFLFGFGDISVDCQSFDVQVTRGAEFVSVDGNVISATYTPENTTSVAKVVATAVYEGRTYSKEFTILVQEAKSTPDNPDNPDTPTVPDEPDVPGNPDTPQEPNSPNDTNEQKGGCGTIAFDFTDFTGGSALMILCAGFFIALKRKLKNKLS